MGKQYNTTLISYYDKANGFGLDQARKTLFWSMPFDWNASRIREAPNFLVHEEVRIPKNMSGIGNTNFFSGTVNGQPLAPERILVDPYSNPGLVAVHYLLDKFYVLQVVGTVGNETQMRFTLSAGATISQNQTTRVWQAERTTVLADWHPKQLASGKPSVVNVQFIDRFGTGQTINGDVHYDLNIRDVNGTILYSKPGLIAKSGQDAQTLTFPANATYVMEAKITSVDRPNLPTDTRIDTARGIVVVPEFPAGIMGLLISFLAITLVLRWFGTKPPRSPLT